MSKPDMNYSSSPNKGPLETLRNEQAAPLKRQSSSGLVREEVRALRRIAVSQELLPKNIAKEQARIKEKYQLLREQERLTALLLVDELTKIPSRAAWEKAINREYGRDRREGHPILIFTFDADGFKNINDTFGHATGDNALKYMAAAARSALHRDGMDFVARWGGDEFWGFAPITVPEGLSPEDRGKHITSAARAILENIRSAVDSGEYQIADVDKPKLSKGLNSGKVTVSIGAVVYHGDATPLKELLAQADEALYDSKKAGKNNFTISDIGYPVTKSELVQTSSAFDRVKSYQL